MKLFGARRRAAGAVDMNDHSAGVRLAKPFQGLGPLLVAADQAGNLDAGDGAGGGVG